MSFLNVDFRQQVVHRLTFQCHAIEYRNKVPSAVENGVGPHNANHLPGVVIVLVLQFLMEEIQIACKKRKHVKWKLAGGMFLLAQLTIAIH